MLRSSVHRSTAQIYTTSYVLSTTSTTTSFALSSRIAARAASSTASAARRLRSWPSCSWQMALKPWHTTQVWTHRHVPTTKMPSYTSVWTLLWRLSPSVWVSTSLMCATLSTTTFRSRWRATTRRLAVQDVTVARAAA